MKHIMFNINDKNWILYQVDCFILFYVIYQWISHLKHCFSDAKLLAIEKKVIIYCLNQ